MGLLGSRGVPGAYGGYETLLDELGARLVAAGFRVTVYCRSHFTPKTLREHRGMELVVLPTLRTKYLDTPVHTLLSCLDARQRGLDAVLMVNSANALFLPLLSGVGIATALHVDGIEKRRAKWGPVGRAVYALSERLAAVLPDRLITDAEVIRAHYLERYRAPSTVITYGVTPEVPALPEVFPRLGLEPRRYFLYVSRFEPENNPHRVAEAYRGVGGDLPLVMVGGSALRSRVHPQLPAGSRPAHPVSRSDLRRRLPGAPGPCPRLRSCDGSRRHAPGVGRGHGLRQLCGGQ